MLTKRIIPCLDVRDGRVVKGVNFVNIVDAGDPVEAAKRYNEEGADELVFLDIMASADGRKTVIDMVRSVAEQVFIPFTVGGGITNIDWIHELLKNGADKVSINSAAVRRPDFINEASARFGSQCIVVAIDCRAIGDRFDVYINGGRVNTGKDAVEWAIEAQKRGAGEILLTSMDADGTKEGFDIKATKAITDAVSIPVIASGGAGCLSHFKDVFLKANADAALAASLFHYRELEIAEVKQYLKQSNIPVRM